jgi:pilus assembly protein FimV
MLAIQALNPDAFIDGNINRLKTGHVLRLPDTRQSTALSQPKAIAEVSAQNTAWRQGRRAATNQATASSNWMPPSAPAPVMRRRAPTARTT